MPGKRCGNDMGDYRGAIAARAPLPQDDDTGLSVIGHQKTVTNCMT
jgi:hypothetical protein